MWWISEVTGDKSLVHYVIGSCGFREKYLEVNELRRALFSMVQQRRGKGSDQSGRYIRSNVIKCAYLYVQIINDYINHQTKMSSESIPNFVIFHSFDRKHFSHELFIIMFEDFTPNFACHE